MYVQRTANADHESLIHDIITAQEKQATRSGICFSASFNEKALTKSNRECVSTGFRVCVKQMEGVWETLDGFMWKRKNLLR